MPSRGAGSPQKKRRKRGPKKSRRETSRSGGLIIDGDSCTSSKNAGYEKKSEFVKALLNHKAKEGAKERQKNGGRMPRAWYPDAIKSLKSNPGCSEIDFKQSDLENRVRKIVRENEKNEKEDVTPPAVSLTSAGDHVSHISPRPQIIAQSAVTSEESQSESGQSPSEESDATSRSPMDLPLPTASDSTKQKAIPHLT